MRTLLPGYLKEPQRSATEEALMRLDSLSEALEENRMYIDNYFKVTDTGRIPGDSTSVPETVPELSSDSLMTATNRERRFISQMEERERFNISVLAPLAADGIMFSPVMTSGIFTESGKESTDAEIIMVADDNVRCPADGTVIDVHHIGKGRGYLITLHHNRGFVTTFTGTGTPLVGTGDKVNGGQIIAMTPDPDSRGMRRIVVRMWHNGTALIPYEYIGPGSTED